MFTPKPVKRLTVRVRGLVRGEEGRGLDRRGEDDRLPDSRLAVRVRDSGVRFMGWVVEFKFMDWGVGVGVMGWGVGVRVMGWGVVVGVACAFRTSGVEQGYRMGWRCWGCLRLAQHPTLQVCGSWAGV